MNGINLEYVITPQIQTIVNKKTISLYIYSGQTNSTAGDISTTYNTVTGVKAQVQLTDKQTLKLVNGFSITQIYKDFRIQSTSLTGLNRNLSTAGDYILMDSLYYRIVALPENFTTGWVWVVGEQSGTTIGSS